MWDIIIFEIFLVGLVDNSFYRTFFSLSNLTFGLFRQICRVEDLTVEGTVTGSVIHFHWVRDIFVYLSGAISASGLGMHLSSDYFVNIPAASSQLKVEHVPHMNCEYFGLSPCFLLGCVQAALMVWVEEEFLRTVLVRVVDMVGKEGMDIIMAPSSTVVLRMGTLIYLVNLEVVVEMVVLLVKRQAVGLLV